MACRACSVSLNFADENAVQKRAVNVVVRPIMEERMDTFTKAVLTVIAISLAAIALQNSGVRPAQAVPVPPQGKAFCSGTAQSWNCAHVWLMGQPLVM
jgi:hypothetical protein